MIIEKIYIGKEQNFNSKSKTFKSSYKKSEVKDKIFISFLGLKDDSQSDKKLHGGRDRAVCVYNQSSYEFLRNKYKISLDECAFGENITLKNASDEDICLGDTFSCGEAIFEVCQPRLPCWKISFITGIKNLTSIVVKEAKTGFQLRVLKEGFISFEDKFSLLTRANKNISIAHINRCYFDARNNQENIEEILKVPQLAKSYKTALEQRYKNKEKGIEFFQKDIE